MAEYTRDKAVRAKQEAKLARDAAEDAKNTAEEVGYEAGMADT